LCWRGGCPRETPTLNPKPQTINPRETPTLSSYHCLLLGQPYTAFVVLERRLPGGGEGFMRRRGLHASISVSSFPTNQRIHLHPAPTFPPSRRIVVVPLALAGGLHLLAPNSEHNEVARRHPGTSLVSGVAMREPPITNQEPTHEHLSTNT